VHQYLRTTAAAQAAASRPQPPLAGTLTTLASTPATGPAAR